jgi:hypothetical protein
MHTYNLFRHRDNQDLVCAVPEDCAVPGFIAGRVWDFDRKLTEPATVPMGFNTRAATNGVRLNGFYLFQSLGEYTFDIRQ